MGSRGSEPQRGRAHLLGRVALAGVAGLALGWTAQAQVLPMPAPGDRVPALWGETLKGEIYHADWSRQRLTLVNFWATWCEPCRQEMPNLQRLYEQRREEGFLVLGVHVGRPDDPVAQFVESLGIGYPVLRVRVPMLETWAALGVVPTSWLVDSEGRLVRRYVGSDPQLLQDVAAYLEGRPLPAMVNRPPSPTTDVLRTEPRKEGPPPE